MPNEFLFVIDDGEDGDDVKLEASVMPSQPRIKGAYYKNIERKMLLKKKRISVSKPSLHRWHVFTAHVVVRPSHEEMAFGQGTAHKDGR